MSACNINLTPEDKEFANSLCEYIINNADSISISEVLTESFSDTVSEVSNKVVLRIYKYVESKLKGSIEDSLLHSEIQKSYDKYIELQNNATPEFNIDSSLKFNTNQNKFIYLIDNMSLNSELYLTSKADFTKILLLSIQNNSNIDDQIYELVSAYLSDIYTYLYPDSAEEFELTKDNYINLLTEALVKVKDNLRISLNNPAHISKVKLNKQHIEILRKIHVLNNFDNLLEHFLGVVSITPSLKGKIVYVDKYSLALEGLMHKGYGDDSSKSDSNNILSKLLLLMWNTIPDGSGGFLNKKDFEYIIQKLNLNGNRKYDSIDKVIRELKTNVKDFGLKGVKVAEWLEELKDSYNKTLQDTTLPITYKKNLEHYFNFTDTFMYQIQVRNNVAYISADLKGATVKQPEIYHKDKSYIYNGMLNTLLENITEKGNLTFVTYSEYLSIKNYPLTSKEYINFLNKLTGLHLTPESMSRLLSENSQDSKGETTEDKIREFVHTYTREVSNLRLLLLNAKLSLDARVGLAQIKDLINDFIQKKIVFDPTYVAFSDIIVKNNYDSTMKVLDLKGNQLANSAIPNNFLKLHENILLLQDVLRRELDANILITTDYQGKATTSKYIKKDASNIYDKYCYSAYRGAVQIGNDVIDHEKLTSEELMSLSFNYEFIDSACNNNTVFLQPICYADKTRIGLVGFNANALIGDFKLRDGSLQKRVASQRKGYYRNLEEDIITRYNKVFNKNFSSLDEVLSFILNNLSLIKGNIHKLRDGIDIIKTKNSKGDTLYTFNYVLYQFILDAHLDNGNIDKLIETARKNFKKTFYSIKIPALFKEQSYLNNNKKFFKELFEIKESDWETFVKAIRTNKTWDGVEEDLKSKAISISDKYFYISNLGSDSILQTAGLVFTSYGDSKQGERDIKIFDENKIKTLLSENFAKGTKRHNFFTASYQSPLIGTKYGVNQYSNYLVVEDLSQDITNYYGDEHGQDVHDGMILASALQTYWELNSYPELDYGETMKVIGLMPSGFTARLIKCAQYSISNWKIRQGFDSNDPKVWNLKKLNERLLKSGKLSPNFILKLTNPDLNIAADIAINENGTFYQFLGFEIEPSGEVSTIWESNEGATTKITRRLETAYDLWELLGAEWSYALQDGDYVESENSMKITADLISECSPETKLSMITKIIPKAAFKTGLENIHSISLVYDDNFELKPIQWNNDYLGIQQDYDHEADDSEVPSLTQLISNVAFNGANVELVNQIWDTLSFLIQRSLKKYDYLANDGADLDTVHRRIAKMMLEKVQSSGSPSNNLTKLLEEAMKGNGLVISDLSLFYKFASDLMALLNHTSIKSKFRGIAIIQNPSHGLLGIYETADGGVLMEEDARKNPIEITETDVDVNELGIEDIVIYDGITEPVRISNIHDLKELKRKQEEGIKLRKVHNVKRNLKSPTLTYKVMEEGKEVTKSWWLAPWTLERWEAEAEYKKNPTKANALRVMKSKRWYLANLKALENNTLFPTEDLSNPILIISYNYTGGEQVLPKVFKTKYGLKNSTTLHEVLSRGEEFFIEQFNEVYKQPEENITSYTQGKFSLGFFFKDYNVYYTENTQLDSAIRIDLTEDNTIVEEGNRWYTVNGKKQFIVPSEANAIYKDNNNFIVNAKVEGENADNKFIQTLTEQEECKGALAYFKNKVANTKNKTIKYVLNSFNPFNYNSLSKKEGLDAAIQHCAALKLKGFKLTLDTISVRIPTQAFQSFMRNTTVGFTNSDSNDGYINLMQIWFTGGDYDIDKSYTLMYDTDENGVVPTTSNLYKKGLDIDKCFDLPLPDSNKNINLITTDEELSNGWDVIFTKIGTKIINNDLGNLILDKLKRLALDYVDCNTSYELFKEALALVNSYNNELHVNIVNNSEETQKFINLINDLNTHNNTNTSKTALQNRITNGLIRCSGNVNNMQASQQPMTSDEIKELIDDCEKELENFDKTKYSNFSKTFDVFNPTAKWEIQQEAIVGKGDVGISANGIKVDSLLLLYYNDYYRTWDPETPIEETYKVDVPIKLWIQNEKGEYKTVINKNIVRFGDTVLDKDDTIAFKKFKALYKDISDQDLYKEKEYLILLQGLKDPFSLTTRREKNAYTSYITIIGNEKLNRENYLRWLFEKEKLGSRVSDNLSVFISLAVDNMKEMQLARIYGNEELLKIPLTLIMLGVDPHDVMLFCKTMLKPIYEELSVNRYNSKKKGLASIISREIHNYKDNPARFIFSKDEKTNKAVAQQILNILKIADNTTLLSKVFKINQGLTATYGDLTNEQASLNIALSEVAGAEITLEDLFLDSTLALKTEKRGFDIIDVIKKSRYFKTMHEAALKLIRNVDSVASRAFVHKKLSRHAGDLKDKNTRELALRGFLYLYDHFIIGKTLQSLTQFTFTKESLEKGLNTDLGNLPIIAGKPFALNSNDNLALFIQVMDELIIPKLQKQYPNNYAIKSFTKVFSKRLNRNVYDLPFNNLDTNNIEELENLKRAIAEFSLIANNNSGLLNIANLPITIIDALNVYQMITKRDSISSFKEMVTENSVMGKNLVYTRKNNIIKGYDNNIYDHMTQWAPLRNDLLLELLDNQELINAVLGTSDSIELEHAMVWTLEKPKKKLSRDLFISELRSKGIEVEQLNGDNYRIHYGDYDKIHYIPKEVDTKGVANEILSNYEALKFITDYMNNVFLSEELKNNLEQNKVFNEITSQLFSGKALIYNTIIPNNNIDYLLQPSYIIEFNTVVKLNFTSDNPSENEVVYTLLNYKFGDNLPEHVKYLQTNLTQDNKQEVIDAYTEYYLNNNITKQDLHNALNFLQDSVDYLKAEDVFYELRFSKKDASSLQEGDLIEINNDTFIFAGNYNKSNKLINVNTGEILYNKDTLYDAKKLKVPFGTQISKLKPTKKELGKKGKLKDLPINSTFELQGVRYRIVYKFVSSNGDIETVVVDNNEGIGSFLNSQGNIEVNYVELNTNKEDMTTIVLEGMQNPEEYLAYIKAGDTVTINSEEGVKTATVITITKDKKIRVDKLDTPVELSNVKLVQLSTRISSSEFTQEAYNDKDNKDTFNYEGLYTPLKHLPSKFNKGDIIKRNNKLYKIYSVSNNEIIAEVFTCNKETSASSLEVLPHTIEVFTPKDIDIVYTKDKTTIYNDIAELQALDTSGDLSLDAKATLFIGHLKELGLKVRYTTGLTRFEGDVIYINENYKTDVLHLLMHEATHLALANLKLNSREAYLYLLEEVKKLPLDASLQALFLSIDNDPRYPTELDKLEEKLIRYMDEKFKSAFILNSKDTDFNDADIFNKYLKYSLAQMGLKMELGKILTNLIIDKFNLKKFDLEKVTQDKVIDSVLSNVKRVC